MKPENISNIIAISGFVVALIQTFLPYVIKSKKQLFFFLTISSYNLSKIAKEKGNNLSEKYGSLIDIDNITLVNYFLFYSGASDFENDKEKKIEIYFPNKSKIYAFRVMNQNDNIIYKYNNYDNKVELIIDMIKNEEFIEVALVTDAPDIDTIKLKHRFFNIPPFIIDSYVKFSEHQFFVTNVFFFAAAIIMAPNLFRNELPIESLNKSFKKEIYNNGKVVNYDSLQVIVNSISANKKTFTADELQIAKESLLFTEQYLNAVEIADSIYAAELIKPKKSILELDYTNFKFDTDYIKINNTFYVKFVFNDYFRVAYAMLTVLIGFFLMIYSLHSFYKYKSVTRAMVKLRSYVDSKHIVSKKPGQ